MRSDISYGKILRAHQKFASLNKTLAFSGDTNDSASGAGGIFNLTEHGTNMP